MTPAWPFQRHSDAVMWTADRGSGKQFDEATTQTPPRVTSGTSAPPRAGGPGVPARPHQPTPGSETVAFPRRRPNLTSPRFPPARREAEVERADAARAAEEPPGQLAVPATAQIHGPTARGAGRVEGNHPASAEPDWVGIDGRRSAVDVRNGVLEAESHAGEPLTTRSVRPQERVGAAGDVRRARSIRVLVQVEGEQPAVAVGLEANGYLCVLLKRLHPREVALAYQKVDGPNGTNGVSGRQQSRATEQGGKGESDESNSMTE